MLSFKIVLENFEIVRYNIKYKFEVVLCCSEFSSGHLKITVRSDKFFFFFNFVKAHHLYIPFTWTSNFQKDEKRRDEGVNFYSDIGKKCVTGEFFYVLNI
jgi:hypothetical protein